MTPASWHSFSISSSSNDRHETPPVQGLGFRRAAVHDTTAGNDLGFPTQSWNKSPPSAANVLVVVALPRYARHGADHGPPHTHRYQRTKQQALCILFPVVVSYHHMRGSELDRLLVSTGKVPMGLRTPLPAVYPVPATWFCPTGLPQTWFPFPWSRLQAGQNVGKRFFSLAYAQKLTNLRVTQHDKCEHR